MLSPDGRPIKDTPRSHLARYAVYASLELQPFLLRWARASLPVIEAMLPGDSRPLRLLEATERWAQGKGPAPDPDMLGDVRDDLLFSSHEVADWSPGYNLLRDAAAPLAGRPAFHDWSSALRQAERAGLGRDIWLDVLRAVHPDLPSHAVDVVVGMAATWEGTLAELVQVSRAASAEPGGRLE